MASYAVWEAARGRYVLGPPLIPAQENHPPRETWNPTFELAYWKHVLEIAQRWRERLHLKRDAEWDEVIRGLSALPVRDGVYLAHENCPQTFSERNHDHPSMLGALGVLPGDGVDRETMRLTLRKTDERMEVGPDVGLGLPANGDDRSSPRRNDYCCRRALDDYGEESLLAKRS